MYGVPQENGGVSLLDRTSGDFPIALRESPQIVILGYQIARNSFGTVIARSSLKHVMPFLWRQD
jgi:hypothetical protein